MKLLRLLPGVLAVSTFAAVDVMNRGKWCYRCGDVAEEACKDGMCGIPLPTHDDNFIDSEPSNVDWGGGDGGGC